MSWLLGGGAAEEGKARERGAEAEAGGGSGGGDAASGSRAYTERWDVCLRGVWWSFRRKECRMFKRVDSLWCGVVGAPLRRWTYL